MLVSFLCFFFPFVLQDEPFVDETLQVEYVVLDVFAHGEDGAPVTDLAATDFAVWDDKRRVDIETFQVLDFREPPFARGNQPAEVDPVQQTMILIMDFALAGPEEVQRAIIEIQDFLIAMEERQDLQIFIISLEKGFVTQGFTSNPDQALSDLMAFEAGLADDLQQNALNARQFSLVSLEANLGSCFTKSMKTSDQFGPGSASSVVAPCLESAYNVYTEAQTRGSNQILGLLGKVMTWLSRVKGLKSLYFVSPGLSVYPGRSGAGLAQDYLSAVEGKVSGGSFTNISSINRTSPNPGDRADDPFLEFDARTRKMTGFQHESLESRYRAVAHLALAQRMVLHTFTLPKDHRLDRQKGSFAQSGTQLIDSSQAYQAFDKELEEGLVRLATTTGGVHVNNPALADAIQKTVQDRRFYYVLGYPKSAKGKLKFREIRIECQREGVSLGYHAGYYAGKSKRGKKKKG